MADPALRGSLLAVTGRERDAAPPLAVELPALLEAVRAARGPRGRTGRIIGEEKGGRWLLGRPLDCATSMGWPPSRVFHRVPISLEDFPLCRAFNRVHLNNPDPKDRRRSTDPQHAFQYVTEDVFLFLHADTPRPTPDPLPLEEDSQRSLTDALSFLQVLGRFVGYGHGRAL